MLASKNININYAPLHMLHRLPWRTQHIIRSFLPLAHQAPDLARPYGVWDVELVLAGESAPADPWVPWRSILSGVAVFINQWLTTAAHTAGNGVHSEDHAS